jgi:outer membrane protein assembly factor BamB
VSFEEVAMSAPSGTLATVAAVLVLLTGCGGSRPPEATRSTGTPTPVPGPDRPDRVVPLAQRLQARITVPPGDGDDVVEVGGSIWIKMEDGYLTRVDPATNKVVDHIRLDEEHLDFRRHCQGLGTDGTSLWTCAANASTAPIVRVDPATGEVVERFGVDKYYDQLWLPYAAGRIWVLTDGGRTLAGLHEGGDVEELALPMTGTQVTGSGDALLVTSALEDAVVRLDPSSGEVLAEATVRRPTALSATAEDVWVGTTDGLVRLDARTLRPRTVYRVLGGADTGDVAAADDEVWVRVRSGFLYRIDPASGAVTDQVTADPRLSGGSVLVTEDSVWTTAYDNRALFRLSR